VFFWPAIGSRILPPYLAPGWTLCFEMIFYTSVAFMLAGGRLWRNLTIALAIVGLLAILRPAGAWLGWRMLLNPVFLEFGLGILLAIAWRRFRWRSAQLGAVLILFAIVIYYLEIKIGVGDAWTMDSTLYDTEAMRRTVLFGTPAALLVTGALLCEEMVKGALARLLTKGGDASYSLYLAHGVWMLLLFHLWKLSGLNPAPWIVFWTALPSAFMVGFLVYRFVERPLIGWARSWPSPVHFARRQVRPAESPG
jgi:exopolysaccharide production protein ExoZ